MTWTKFGSEFFDDCANAGLTDAAVRTHAEAISWVYKVENIELGFPRNLIRRFAGSDRWESAVEELVTVGWWVVHDDFYVLIHHADVIRASIVAQQVKRERDKRSQQAYRKRSAAPSVSADVSAATDSQTVSQDRKRSTHRGVRVNEDTNGGTPGGRPPSNISADVIAGSALCDLCGSFAESGLDEFGYRVCVGRCVSDE